MAISFAEKYSTILIQFFTTVILARILTPEDIGIFSVGVVIVGLAHTFRDFGVSHYLVQEKELTKERIRTAFGITLIIAWSAAALLLLFSNIVEHFYDESGVREVVQILAISFFFIPFSSTVLGLLRREMKFERLFVINVATTIVNSCVSLALAFLGFGFESLAWASLAGAITTVSVAVYLRPKGAQFYPSLTDFKRIFSFGSYTSGAAIAQEIGVSMPDLTIGKTLGFSELGYFSRAVGLISIFNYTVTAALNPIITPYFAKRLREGKSLRRPYLQSIEYFTVISWPFFAYLGIMAEPITLLLYGDQWVEAVQAAQILCFAFIIRSFTAFGGHCLLSMGEARLYFSTVVIIQIPNIFLIIATSFISIEAVAISQIFYYIVIFITFHHFLNKRLQIQIKDISQATRKSMFILILTTLSTFIVYTVISPYNLGVLPEITATGTVWAASYIAGIFVFNHNIKQELSIHIFPIINRTLKRVIK